MAIDSLQKRSSALGFGVFDLTLPPADGAVGQADRQHAVGFYSGILAIAEAVATVSQRFSLEGTDDQRYSLKKY